MWRNYGNHMTWQLLNINNYCSFIWKEYYTCIYLYTVYNNMYRWWSVMSAWAAGNTCTFMCSRKADLKEKSTGVCSSNENQNTMLAMELIKHNLLAQNLIITDLSLVHCHLTLLQVLAWAWSTVTWHYYRF